MRLIGQAHTLVHQNGVLRVQTDIRAGTRTDKVQHFSEKVSKVESILAADSSSAGAKADVAPTATASAAPATPAEDVKGEQAAPAKQTWASMFAKK
jgi:hypothetical protein